MRWLINNHFIGVTEVASELTVRSLVYNVNLKFSQKIKEFTHIVNVPLSFA